MQIKLKPYLPFITLLIFLCVSFISSAQYLSNPSFEGTPQHDVPPPSWNMCNDFSTVDTQPESVFTPPSDGNSYIGMTCRGPFAWAPNTWEDVQAPFILPLSMDSCYRFSIDLAFGEPFGYVMEPVSLIFYGSDEFCEKKNILWQSPPINHDEWQTYEFTIHPYGFDYTFLLVDAYYTNPELTYDGYALLDNIIIETYPDMELGADTTLAICDDGYYEINAGSGWASYLWQDGSTDSTFLVTESGEYWVTVTSPDGCPATDTIQVTIEEYLDMITEPSGNTIVCQGESADIWVTTYNGVPPYIYEWEELLFTTDTINVTPEETTVYYVTITDECENVVTDSVKVIVIPLPELDIGNDTLICNGDSLVLNAGGGFESYLWQDQSTDSIFIVTEPGTYYVNVTGLAGCENFDGIVVDFIDIEVSIGNDTIVCEGDTVMFYAGPDFLSYQWQDGSTSPYFYAWETGFYWVEVNNNEGCSAIDSVFLLVDTNFPEVSLGSDTTICFGEPYTLNPGFFLSYQWSDGSGNPTLTVYEPGDYWVIVQGGCGYAEDTVSVDYYDPVDVDIGPDSTLCFGQFITLDAGFGFVEYLWNDGSSFQSVTVYESGTYSITVQDYLGCYGYDDAVIEIADTVNLGQDTIFCDGETVVLNAGFGFDQYTWNNGTNSQVLEVSETGNYFVDVAYLFGCPSSDSVYLEKLALPNADLGNDNDLCDGETLTLYGPEGPFEYFWNGVQGGQALIVSETGQYELKVTNACGEDTDLVQVNAFPIPEVYLGENVVLMPGETLNLDAGQFEDYLWQDGTNNRYYMVSYDDYSDSLYHVEVFDGHCKNSDSIKIEIFDIFVPIVITPNGDGKNDIFQPDMEKWSGINQHTIQVFNRWGEKVWESDNFPQGWDGKKNGKFVAEGTYFWILEIEIGQNNIQRKYKGSLTIMGAS